MIEVNENLKGFVFAAFSNRADLMVALLQDSEGKYRLKGRSRFYDKKDDPADPFEAKDRKTWFESKKGEENIQVLLDQIERAVNQLWAASETFGFPGEKKIHILLRNERPLMEFLEEWMTQPFVHRREVTLN